MGYHLAGFDVVGVDHVGQKHYPFEFILADALQYCREHGHEFDAIAASPPCQAHCVLRKLHAHRDYPDLIPQTRGALQATGKPYVIENVPGAPLMWNLMLCGTMFRLQTPCGAQLRRHRIFECSFFVGMVPVCDHGWREQRSITVVGHAMRDERVRGKNRRALCIALARPHDRELWRAEERVMVKKSLSVTGATPQQNVVRNEVRETYSVAEARVAMGIDWMPMSALSQAIPPAYTRWIGKRLMEAL